ncbi:hypothetical protein ACA910_003437 [Epithemia clementina (nom. ined.)]
MGSNSSQGKKDESLEASEEGNNKSSTDSINKDASNKTTSTYHDIIETALANGITTIEVGQEGGDAVLADIFQQQDETETETTTETITLLKRVGYRTVVPSDQNDDNNNNGKDEEGSLSQNKLLPGDLMVEEVPWNAAAAARKPKGKGDEKKDEDENDDHPKDDSEDESSKKPVTPATATALVVHNISKASIQAALRESPLCQPSQQGPARRHDLTVLLHNPEIQATINGQSLTYEQRQARICDKLTESFVALEHEIQEQQQSLQRQEQQRQSQSSSLSALAALSSYGIVSHGLALPPDHDWHLSWKDAVVPALEQAQGELLLLHNGNNSRKEQLPNFSVVQLPLNLWETAGLHVAHEIKQYNSQLQIYAMRPLTAYPTAPQKADKNNNKDQPQQPFPVVFADYQLPATMEKKLVWSHTMTAPPQVYHVAWQAALQHFDAQEILQAKVEGNELTTEQRETLDGCKLLQSLLHDVDVELEKVTSWEAHEQALYRQIIPLIHDTFEGYDEETASVLQRFFAAYSLAVRYSIARNTRQQVQQTILAKEATKRNKSKKKANDKSFQVQYPEFPDDMRLQDYALRFLLSQTYIPTTSDGGGTNDDDHAVSDNKPPQAPPQPLPLVDKLMVGCTETDHILQDLETIHQFYSEQQPKKTQPGQ